MTFGPANEEMEMRGWRDQEAHHMDNIYMVYAHPDRKWTFSGYLKNLWNYAEKRFMGMGTNMTIGPPRIYGVILPVNY